MNRSKNSLKEAFKNKDYRHGYTDEFLNARIATQIKVLREQRQWSQTELANQAGMKQPRISVLEDVNYTSWSISILRKLAEAFDLTLSVSFEDFGTRAKDIEAFSRDNLERHSFPEDTYFQSKPAIITDAGNDRECSVGQTEKTSGTLFLTKNDLTGNAGAVSSVNIPTGKAA